MLFGVAAAYAAPAPLADWPHVTSAIGKDAALEARIAQIVAGMTLPQKIGQMTQPEIKTVTPDQVRQYYIGSVLNGGGSWPKGNKHATAADWTALADQYYDASMSTDMKVKVPVIWGLDAIHGHSNVFGATQFPHNIGLGAAHDKELVRRIAAATGKAVRATGINWVFGPTLAVARDDRWGRTYESFSEDPALVEQYAGAYVNGLQGTFADNGNVVASVKHFLGDGGTERGKDQGVNKSTKAQMINIHARGYYSGLAAGAQTVMASYNSWEDVAGGVNYGKMHGSRELLTTVLKDKLGFDGYVISDWNGIGQIPGCSNDSCAQAINAGVDMIMVPDDWKAFIANTIKQVESGQIPMARIDDAVTRILRVKLRAGMFGQRPSANPNAGKQEALVARELAREAVHKSLVLLKNNGSALPLARGKKILVVGKSANDIGNQNGGWTLTWQGVDNKNSDFPHADSILAGIEDMAGKGNVSFSPDASGVDVARYDAVIAVIGETPYAEGYGDIGQGASLRHTSRHPEDLAVLKAVAGKGKPVVTVFLSGRALFVNDLLNLSDSFVAAWLPGTEGKGVADVLFRGANGKPAYDFTGKLSFSWPKAPCQTPLNFGDADYHPLFALGYGLNYRSHAKLGKLNEYPGVNGCGSTNTMPVFSKADRSTYPLFVAHESGRVALGNDLNAVLKLPVAQVETSQVNSQQDAKLVTWFGKARLEANTNHPRAIPPTVTKDGALQFDTMVAAAPSGKVTVSMGCDKCGATLDLTEVFRKMPLKVKQTVKIPLACFTAKGVQLDKVDTPFAVGADGPFAAAFTNIEIVGGAAKDKDALNCTEAK